MYRIVHKELPFDTLLIHKKKFETLKEAERFISENSLLKGFVPVEEEKIKNIEEYTEIPLK